MPNEIKTQAFLDEYAKKHRYKDWNDMTYVHSPNKLLHIDIHNLLNEYAHQFQQEDKWISVNDRLPNDNEIVSVFFKNTLNENCQCSA